MFHINLFYVFKVNIGRGRESLQVNGSQQQQNAGYKI